MTAAARSDHESLSTLRERPLTSCMELVFLRSQPGIRPDPWTAAPSAVLHSAAPTVALHFAPGRWLLLDADAQAVAAAVGAGALAIDVEGKWRCFELRGARAGAALSAGVNVAMVLEGRKCAAVSLFDCPTIIAMRPGDACFDVYVSASYAASLCSSLEVVMRRCEGS